MAPQDELDIAVKEWIDRNKGRTAHPRGNFDRYGHWEPSPDERRACCAAMKPDPHRKMGIMEHCRSLAHVAMRYNLPVNTLKRAIEDADTGENFYVLAADVQGKLLSVYDPDIEFRLGEMNTGPRPQKGKSGGYIVYKTQVDAMFAERPNTIKYQGAQLRVILVRADGAYMRRKKQYIFSRIIPLEVLTITLADSVAALKERREL